MGIKIIGETLLSEIGITLTDCVLTFNGRFSVRKLFGHEAMNNLPYQLAGCYTLWGSEQAYLTRGNCRPLLADVPVYVDINEEQLEGNLLGILYDKIKEKYPNAIDN